MSIRSIIFRKIFERNFVNKPALFITFKKFESKYREKKNTHRRYYGTALASSVLIGTVFAENLQEKKDESKTFEAGEKRPDLPTYKAEEIMEHNTTSNFWVTYRHGVYDVTSFLPSHPGGEQILNAAGLSIEPFWNVYGMHKTTEIFTLLESFRIGNLHDDDVVDHSDDEMWVREPCRSKELTVKTARPFNAETPPQAHLRDFNTPNDVFYVRQHMPVPDIDPEAHELTVIVRSKGVDEKVVKFSLEELKSFPEAKVNAALMCAGNRRSEMNKVKPVKGIDWTTGAIGNADWEGVFLYDVLTCLGVKLTDEERHVILMGADMDATGVNFSTSIPLGIAMDPQAKVTLCWSMNGCPLPKDHGAPLRVLVPGAPAVRSVKWLETIIISEDESPSHWHQKDYRAFNPSKTWETADFPSAPPLYSLPVTSAICDPVEGETLTVNDGCVTARGYAYSGGGARIVRVDVSTDGGATWQEADLQTSHNSAKPTQPRAHYAWALWTVKIPVKDSTEMEIWAKATDSNFNTQPEKFDDIWNIRGILSNAYHKIKVTIKNT